MASGSCPEDASSVQIIRTEQKDQVALLLEKRHATSQSQTELYTGRLSPAGISVRPGRTSSLPCFFLLSKTVSLVVLCSVCASF